MVGEFDRKVLEILENLHNEEFFQNAFKLLDKDKELSFLKTKTIASNEEFETLCSLIKRKKLAGSNITTNFVLHSMLMKYSANQPLKCSLEVYRLMNIFPNTALQQRIKDKKVAAEERAILEAYLIESAAYQYEDVDVANVEHYVGILKQWKDNLLVIKILTTIAEKGSCRVGEILKKVFEAAFMAHFEGDFYTILVKFLIARAQPTLSHEKQGDKVFCCFNAIQELQLSAFFWESCHKFYTECPPVKPSADQPKIHIRRVYNFYKRVAAVTCMKNGNRKKDSKVPAKKHKNSEPVSLQALLKTVWTFFPKGYPNMAVVGQFCGRDCTISDASILSFVKDNILSTLLHEFYDKDIESYLRYSTKHLQFIAESMSISDLFSEFSMTIIREYFAKHNEQPDRCIESQLQLCTFITKYKFTQFPEVKAMLDDLLSSQRFTSNLKLEHLSQLLPLKDYNEAWFDGWLKSVYRQAKVPPESASITLLNVCRNRDLAMPLDRFAYLMNDLMSIDVRTDWNKMVHAAMQIYGNFFDPSYLENEIKTLKERYEGKQAYTWLETYLVKYYPFFNNISKYQRVREIIKLRDPTTITDSSTLGALSAPNFLKMVEILVKIPENSIDDRFLKYIQSKNDISDDVIRILHEIANEGILSSMNPSNSFAPSVGSMLCLSQYLEFQGKLLEITNEKQTRGDASPSKMWSLHPALLFELHQATVSARTFDAAVQKIFNIPNASSIPPCHADLTQLKELIKYIDTRLVANSFLPRGNAPAQITVYQSPNFQNLLNFWNRYPGAQYFICSPDTSRLLLSNFVQRFLTENQQTFVLVFVDRLPSDLCELLRTFLRNIPLHKLNSSLFIIRETLRCPQKFSLDEIQCTVLYAPKTLETTLLQQFLATNKKVKIYKNQPGSQFIPDLIIDTYSNEYDVISRLRFLQKKRISVELRYKPGCNTPYHLMKLVFSLLVLNRVETPYHCVELDEITLFPNQVNHLAHFLFSSLEKVPDSFPCVHQKLFSVLGDCPSILSYFDGIFVDSVQSKRFKSKELDAFIDELFSIFKIPPNFSYVIENDVLKSRVFQIFFCILAKQPIIVHGQSGTSKSLAMALIYYNLRRTSFIQKLKRTAEKLKFALPCVSDLSEKYFRVRSCVGATSKETLYAEITEFYMLSSREKFFPIVLFESVRDMEMLENIQNFVFSAVIPAVSIVVLSNVPEGVPKSFRFRSEER